jgi:hypothetical protein
VFLAENEDYIQDVGCSFDCRALESDTLSGDSLPANLCKFFKSGGFRGRLRIASSSIYVDIDTIVCSASTPITYFKGRILSCAVFCGTRNRFSRIGLYKS